MAKKMNSREFTRDKQIASACCNPTPWEKFPKFPTTERNIAEKYPTLEDANLKASRHYLDMFMKEREQWEMTEDDVIKQSYTSYRIKMSDRRGFLTALATSVPTNKKVNWLQDYDAWDIYDTLAEAQENMAEDFLNLLGCYPKIQARVVRFCSGYEVQIKGFYRLKDREE